MSLKTLVISGGGTGGHFNPMVAKSDLCQYLQSEALYLLIRGKGKVPSQ